MKAEQAKQMTTEALEQLAGALKQGRSETLHRFLAVLARFHRYSFGNVLLIMFQRPDATRIAGFQTWKSLGRYVKKGEKGIAIMAPMMLRRRDEATSAAQDQPERLVLRFKVVHVFDVVQTEGEPLAEFAERTGNPGPAIEHLKAFIASRSITLEYTDELMGALGMSSGGRIRIRTGMDPAQEFGVLVHEVAHELLHQGAGAERGGTARVETEAEAVACVVCQAVGLQNGTASSDYIQLHDGDADTLAGSLDRIQKTAAMLIEAIVEDTAPDATA